MCVRSQSQPGRENQHKLLYSVHRFLSCLVLGPGITSEETSIRYTAFVCFFFFFFFFKKLFPSTFSLPHRLSWCMLGISGFAQVSPVGQYTEIVTKGRLGTDLIDTGCDCCIHFILLVPPRWQDLKAKACPVCHTPKARGQYPLVFQ